MLSRGQIKFIEMHASRMTDTEMSMALTRISDRIVTIHEVKHCRKEILDIKKATGPKPRIVNTEKSRRPLFFKFGTSGAEHKRGDKHCKGCRWNHPTRCARCATAKRRGFLHIEIQLSEANPEVEGTFVLICDTCELGRS